MKKVRGAEIGVIVLILVKSVRCLQWSWMHTTNLQLHGVVYCVILYLLQPQCIKCRILKAQWLPGLLLINVWTIALNSISMNLCLLCWNSMGISCGPESGHRVLSPMYVGTGCHDAEKLTDKLPLYLCMCDSLVTSYQLKTVLVYIYL